MYCIEGNSELIYLNIGIENQNIQVLHDSGATVSIINRKTFEKLKLKGKLEKSSNKLESYTKTLIGVIGEVPTEFRYKDITCPGKLVVVKEGRNLLGLPELKKFGLVPQEVISIESSSDFNDFIENWTKKGLFNAGGYAKDFKLSLKLKENVQPNKKKIRKVPFAYKTAVKREIYRLLETGILKKCEASEWISLVVTVKKPDGSIRLCGDFRNLNNNLVMDYYPISNATESITSIDSNAKRFASINMKNAYLQLPLDKHSQRLTTIVMSEGTFCYTITLFGVCVAPGVFQRYIKKITEGLSGVLVYLDDILIMEKTELKLTKRLDALFTRLNEKNLKLNLEKCLFNKE